MTDTETPGAETVLAVLRMIGPYDMAESFMFNWRDWAWEGGKSRKIDPTYSVAANCSDVFSWGSADAEEVTPENLHILQQTIDDLMPLEKAEWRALVTARNAGEPTDDFHPSAYSHVADLFSARVRGMRPQGACYKYYAPSIWHLFDACGPEREVGFGNPHKPADYASTQ